MKKIIKASIISVLAFTTSIASAQTTGNIGKNTYPILGSQTGMSYTAGDDPQYHNYSAYAKSGPRVTTYAKFDKDSLFATEEQYDKDNAINVVFTYRIKYNVSDLEITMREREEGKLYIVKCKNLNNNDAMFKKWKYTTTSSLDYSGGAVFLELLFNTKESAQKFYDGLKNGTPLASTTQNNTISQPAQVKSEAEEVKIKIKNTGSDVAEMYYQKSPGSRDNYSFRVQKGQSAELKINVGCSLFFNVKGGRGPLILTATKAMDGTTQVVK
ncbi:MAG: hypothetical protein IPL10_19420 [Bacteroidetes bacterium]|nr:hypothetical protein [Bacteroidota bacterium]